MSSTEFSDLYRGAPPAGALQTLAPGLRRILAPNPSPMTLWGTNTYILGTGGVTLVDPGPNLPAHANAILRALGPGEHIARILVTHAHVDHSPLARPLAEASGAKVFAFGPANAGRSQVMQELVATGHASGGEGVDHDFAPDVLLSDGDQLEIGNGAQLEAIWTPGHFAGHLSFAMGDLLLSGDHVMGWASTMISPPDGDLAAFMSSCEKLLARPSSQYFPGHGAPIDAPHERVRWLMAHRETREAEILEALGTGDATIPALTAQIYKDTPKALLPAAQRNVFAHLIALTTNGQTRATPTLSATATFARASD